MNPSVSSVLMLSSGISSGTSSFDLFLRTGEFRFLAALFGARAGKTGLPETGGTGEARVESARLGRLWQTGFDQSTVHVCEVSLREAGLANSVNDCRPFIRVTSF